MKIHRFATGLPARDVSKTTQFYVDHFGFKKKMDIGWFTSMGHDDPAYEVSVVASEHECVPAEFHRSTYGLLAFVVEDAAAEEAQLPRGRRSDRQTDGRRALRPASLLLHRS